MKYLKKFNEAIISAKDYRKELDKIRQMSDITLQKISQIFNPLGIEFVNVDYFISNLKTKKEIESVPVKMKPLLGGIRWAAHNIHTDKIYVCIDESKFLESINSEMKNQILTFLEEVLRHESIHKSQADKRPKVKIRNLENSPSEPKSYFSSTDEIMAYADSFITQCRQRNMSDAEILDIIKSDRKVSWIQNVYAQMDTKTQKRFKKYVYEYLR